MGRTQQGNNNAYCQDNEISWFDWDSIDGAMVAFTSRLVGLRRDHPIFRRRRWFHGRALHGEDVVDLAWLRPDGTEMEDADWESGFAKSIAVFLNGAEMHSTDSLGHPVIDDSFLVVFNAHHEVVTFTLPPERFASAWVAVVDTADALSEGAQYKAGDGFDVEGRSLVLLRATGPGFGS